MLWNAMDDDGLRVPNGACLVEVTAKAEDGGQARVVGQVRLNRQIPQALGETRARPGSAFRRGSAPCALP